MQSFLQKVVHGYIKSDLTRLIEDVRPEPEGDGNINFPLALCTLSYMEYLGGFLIGREGNYPTNIKTYIEKCFDHTEEYQVELLTHLFRHGLTHEYFPRGAVSRNGKRPAVYKGRTQSIVLDAETLANDFISSLEKFSEILDENTYNERMKKALDKINKLRSKYKHLIDVLPTQQNDDESATPSFAPPGSEPIYSSNASTLTEDMHITRDPTIK